MLQVKLESDHAMMVKQAESWNGEHRTCKLHARVTI